MVNGGGMRFSPLTGSCVQVLIKKYDPNQPDGDTIIKGQNFEI